MSHEMSKALIEQPLQIETSHDDVNLDVSPEYTNKMKKSVRFSPKDRKSPLRRALVGGPDKYKEYLKDRDREEMIKQKIALALQKQQAYLMRAKMEAEMSKNKRKPQQQKVGILDKIQYGMVRNESLLQCTQSNRTLRNIIESPGSRNDNPTEFMVNYARQVNERQVAFAIKSAFANKFRKTKLSEDSNDSQEDKKRSQKKFTPVVR